MKEAESEAALVTQAVATVRTTMERVASAWETYDKCLISLHTWLTQKAQSETQSAAEGMQVTFMTLVIQSHAGLKGSRKLRCFFYGRI